MTFLEKLDFLMKRNGDNLSALSKKSGIPYTTLDGLYKKGYKNTKLSTLQRLCEYFHVTLDYLVKDGIIDPLYGLDSQISVQSKPCSERLANACDSLNEEGIEKVIDYAAVLVASGRYVKEVVSQDDNGYMFEGAKKALERAKAEQSPTIKYAGEK